MVVPCIVKTTIWLAISLLATMSWQVPVSQPPSPVSVGFPGRVDQVVLPGSELIAKPIESREQELILRIENTYPHGTDFRYDLVFVGLEPGEFDLRDYLVRRDGSETGELPSIPVSVASILPSGQIKPAELVSKPMTFRSYYMITMMILAMIWVLGLLALLFGRRIWNRAPQGTKRQITMAERLRPLVQQAAAGKLSTMERAELERILINYWRDRLRVQDLPADKLIKYLKQDEQAGALLRQLEIWLHSPRGENQVSIGDILRPYESIF